MDIFACNNRIISDVLNRIMNSRELREIYVYKKYDHALDFLYSGIQIKKVTELDNITDGIIYLHLETKDTLINIIPSIQVNDIRNDYVIYIPDETITYEELSKWGMACPLRIMSNLKGWLLLKGTTFDKKPEWDVPPSFRVLAIMHFYNEADILENTIGYLLDQGLDIYLIDNWSDDGSYEIAEKLYHRFTERIYLERFPILGKSEYYEWYKQLERTEVISREMDYSWFIHYDADEMRVSPWENVTLRQAIYWIDKAGYNCIENTVIDFKLTMLEKSNIFMKDTYFDFRHKKILFDQVKTWKKSMDIELKSSGGHFARIESPKIYPLKFLNRHYPLRSLEQAYKKVFCDRIPRFGKEKRTLGWHGHYDQFYNGKNFLSDSSDLLLWNDGTKRTLYIPLFLECGLKWNESMEEYLSQFEKKKILLYGAGKNGRKVFMKEIQKNDIVGWIDRDFKRLPSIFCRTILSPSEVKNMVYDYVIITVKNRELQQEILLQLKVLAVDKAKIFCVD